MATFRGNARLADHTPANVEFLPYWSRTRTEFVLVVLFWACVDVGSDCIAIHRRTVLSDPAPRPHLVHVEIRVALFQHGTIEEIIKRLDSKKYPLPDDWLEPSERVEKRKQARQEAKERKETRAKEEAKRKADTAKSEVTEEGGGNEEDVEDAETEQSEETKRGDEEGADSSSKRERDTDDGLEDEEELDDTPPMYRQARALFIKPEARMTFTFPSVQARGMLYASRLLSHAFSVWRFSLF